MKRGAVLAFAAAIVCSGIAYDPSAYAAEPKRVAALLASCAALVTVLTRTKKTAGASRLLWAQRAALACVALSLVSIAWGRASGALDIATWTAGVSIAAVALRIRRTGAIAAARLSGLWMGGIAGAIAIVSAVLGARGFALHAGQGNPNWLGLLLATTLPLSLDAILVNVRAHRIFSGRGAICVALSVMELPALYLSHSRVAWAAAGLAVILMVLLAARSRTSKRVTRAVAVAATIIAAFTFSGRAHADDHDAFTGDVPAAHSLAGRAWIWRSSAAAAIDAIPFGVGLGNFGNAFHEAQGRALSKLEPNTAARTYENATTAHQEYLQIAIESGPLAALALFVAFVLGVAAHSRDTRSRFSGGAGALVACGVASLGDSPLRQPAIVILLALVFGAMRASPKPSFRSTKKGDLASASDRSGLAKKMTLAALLIACAWALSLSTRAWLATRVYLASFSEAPDVRVAMLAKSVRLDEGAGEPRLERALLLLAANDPASAIVDLDAAEARMTDTNIFVAKGHARLALGDARAAEREYRAALAWDPGSLRARVGLAESLRTQGRNDDAETEARIAHKLSPGNPRVRDLIDAIHESQSDL